MCWKGENREKKKGVWSLSPSGSLCYFSASIDAYYHTKSKIPLPVRSAKSKDFRPFE